MTAASPRRQNACQDKTGKTRVFAKSGSEKRGNNNVSRQKEKKSETELESSKNIGEGKGKNLLKEKKWLNVEPKSLRKGDEGKTASKSKRRSQTRKKSLDGMIRGAEC